LLIATIGVAAPAGLAGHAALADTQSATVSNSVSTDHGVYLKDSYTLKNDLLAQDSPSTTATMKKKKSKKKKTEATAS
jgi:hypothetical protein